MTPKERLIEAFKKLCDDTPGGWAEVASVTGTSPQGLYQVYSGVKLASGAPRGVGPAVQKALDEHYPGWASAAVGSKKDPAFSPLAKRIAAELDLIKDPGLQAVAYTAAITAMTNAVKDASMPGQDQAVKAPATPSQKRSAASR